MVRNRKGLAPWSLAREAGIESATVDGTIEVPQYVQPVLDTGFVDEKGNWKGVKSSDSQFIIYKDEAIANGALIISPSVNPDGTWPLDMTGFRYLFIAIKPSNGGNYAIAAIMGPDSNSFANLTPVNAATNLRFFSEGLTTTAQDVLNDSAEALTADVWNIFLIQRAGVEYQKLLQFKITKLLTTVVDLRILKVPS